MLGGRRAVCITGPTWPHEQALNIALCSMDTQRRGQLCDPAVMCICFWNFHSLSFVPF